MSNYNNKIRSMLHRSSIESYLQNDIDSLSREIEEIKSIDNDSIQISRLSAITKKAVTNNTDTVANGVIKKLTILQNMENKKGELVVAQQAIREVYETLPKEKKTFIQMRYFQDKELSFQQAAQRLKYSLPTVKKWDRCVVFKIRTKMESLIQ
jgi:DNA-directed RNA polymerase specialized sigma24 family protein